MYYYIMAPLILSLVIALLLGKILIPFLKSIKMGQKILDIGPRWHKSKEGTPFMGGILFILGTLAAVLVFGFTVERKESGFADIYTYIMAFCYAAIGFIDDYTKRLKKQNEGLTRVQKFALVFPVAIIYTVLMKLSGVITSELFIPFANINIDMGIFYYICVVLGIVFIVNSVNIHDGIDGMCGTVTAIIMVMYIIIFYINGNNPGVILTSACLGGLVGYLYYNFYPAKIFMGDTGSLFLGGLVVGIAIWLNIPILLVLFGIVYIIDSLSSMIQIAYYKLTKRRFFKIAPIHHLLELYGWSEYKIVFVAAAITLVMSAVSVLGVVLR
ncbi:MAG: phospho-N-acetylmuramoyl-pentapeptide-transferase [Oscillospiraceae bacterium]|nr:phospho-N-acetylmuramoyl-pentapeptide-transferase [Oscillospiraceae bacterium]